MKHLCTVVLMTIFIFSCKKDDTSIDRTPILTIKWTSVKTETTTKSYRGGILINTKTETVDDTGEDYWEFKTNGDLLLTLVAGGTTIGQTTYTRVQDSLIFEAGTVFGGKVRSKMIEFTKVDLVFRWASANQVANGVDSFYTTRFLYKPTN